MSGDAVVVTGPSGAGKTTLGRALAAATGARFVDADAFHPPANVAKMARGEGLDEADRAGWLDALVAHLEEAVGRGEAVILACSALRRAHRDRLRDAGELRFLHLHVGEAELARRLRSRRGHYAGASLLPSQLATLEAPGEDEGDVLVLDAEGSPEEVLAEARRALARS